MQLSPLQSRLAASLIASCFLIIVYLFFFFPQFATAIELDSLTPRHDDDDGGLVYDRAGDVVDVATDAVDVGGPEYEPEFALFDRGIIGRAPAGVIPLKNNVPKSFNIRPGETIKYVFELSSLRVPGAPHSGLHELRRDLNGSQPASENEGPESDGLELVRRQQPTRTLWITANTCQQPSRISPDQTTMDPPQLSLFVSTSSTNTDPQPGQDDVKYLPFDEGAVMYNATPTTDVFFNIHAPDVSSDYFSTSQPYNFEIAASVDQSYHTVSSSPFSELIWVDSDAGGALLTTGFLNNHSDEVVTTVPYLLFANNKADTRINGLRKSYCGLQREAQIRVPEDGTNGQITTGLRQGGGANLTRQEFYISDLNASSEYVGILVRDPIASTSEKKRDVPGAGGVVFKETEMATKPCRFLLRMRGHGPATH